jgi:hypothetical protein
MKEKPIERLTKKELIRALIEAQNRADALVTELAVWNKRIEQIQTYTMFSVKEITCLLHGGTKK